MSMTDIPATALRARQMYIDRLPVEDIQRETRLPLKEIYYWLDGAPQDDGTTLLSALDRRNVFRKRGPVGARERAKIIYRIMRAAERQVEEIEQRLETDPPPDTERNARSLAVLARTMRELATLAQQERRRKRNEPTHDQPVPRDLGELRRELSRKLEALVAEQQAEISPDA